MLNILVTGSYGQLGSEIKALSGDYPNNYFFTDKDDLDITSEDAIRNFTDENNVDTIINCAAYTAVDNAEEDKRDNVSLHFPISLPINPVGFYVSVTPMVSIRFS